MAVEIRVIGEVTAIVDGQAVPLGPARRQCVLAVVVGEAGRVVSVGELAGKIWAGEIPYRAGVSLTGDLAHLSALLPGCVREEAGGHRLQASTVDLQDFRDLAAKAR